MANNFNYFLTFADTPFVEEIAKSVAMPFQRGHLREEDPQSPIQDQQSCLDLQLEIDRIMPFDFLQDFEFPVGTMGRRGNALACWSQAIQDPVHINTWYYPNSASRWSIFRALATETMYQEMLNNSDETNQATLEMMCVPVGPTSLNPQATSDGISSEMYLFLGRPIAKTQTQYDGLFLLTFVDERYFFQGTPIPELTINQNTQWTDIINECVAALGISFLMPTIPPAYGQPEPDSQLWSEYEQASTLLDAVALNLGMVVTRGLDGTYTMVSPLVSQNIVTTNRGNAQTVVRMLGGNIFSIDNSAIREAVVPSIVHIAFPQYILSPVPHFMNSRYAPQRPSCWYEDGFGGNYTVSVPIASGPPLVSGLTGISDMTIWNTAKAIQNLESDTIPFNASGLTNLASQIATDIWNYKVVAALDETYPGIIDWIPDGLHDIVWTYSSKKRVAGTRVLRGSWNNDVKDMQHGTPTFSGLTNTPIGIGGPSVAQTWRDSFNISGSVSNTTTINLVSGSQSVQFSTINNFPTQNRWRGVINSGQTDQEICFFEGTSGISTVSIVYRGIDGTSPQAHAMGSIVQQRIRNTNYGPNLLTYEKGQYTYPGIWTSGGIQEQVIIPQIQTVQCLSSGMALVNSINSYSGQVLVYDPTQQSGLQFVGQEYVWIQERNNSALNSGALYDGQFAGFSAGLPLTSGFPMSGNSTGSVNPIYLVNAFFFNTVNTTLMSRRVRVEDTESEEPPKRFSHVYPTYIQDAPTAVRRRLWEDEIYETPKRPVQMYFTQDAPTSVRRYLWEDELVETPRKITSIINATMPVWQGQYENFSQTFPFVASGLPNSGNIIKFSNQVHEIASGEFWPSSGRYLALHSGYMIFWVDLSIALNGPIVYSGNPTLQYESNFEVKIRKNGSPLFDTSYTFFPYATAPAIRVTPIISTTVVSGDIIDSILYNNDIANSMSIGFPNFTNYFNWQSFSNASGILD